MDGQQPTAALPKYFGSVPKEELPGLLPTLEQSWREALDRHQLPRSWYLIWCQTYGVDPNTGHQTGVQYIGEEIDSLRFRTNLSRPNVRQSIMLALGERPKFQGVATNNDVSSLSQVPMTNKIIDYALREARLDAHGYAAVEVDRYFGQGYLWLTWDVDGGEKVPGTTVAKDEKTGEPLTWDDPETGKKEPVLIQGMVRSGTVKMRRLFPWQVVGEVFSEEASWRIVKEAISKFELAARFPDDAAYIMSIDNFNSELDRELFAFNAECSTTDLVILRHVYHKPCAAVPEGRYAQVLDGKTLDDDVCPLDQWIPVFPMCTMRYFATSLGYPEQSDLVAQQEVLDDVLSQVVNNLMKFGNESLWAEAGVEWDKDVIAAGGGFFTLGANQKPPQAIQWAAMPEIAKYILEYLPGVMNQISGLNATVLGKPEGNVESGTAMALMVNVAERYQHATQAAYDHLLYLASNATLELTRKNAENGYAIAVSGVGNQPFMKYFKQSALQSVRSVQVVRANPLMAEFPVRMEVFRETKDLPKDQKRQAYAMLLNNDLTPITEDDDQQTFLIAYENEQLLNGIWVEPDVMDDPRIHNLSHRTWRDKLRSLPPSDNPELEQQRINGILMFNKHIQGHAIGWLSLDRTLGATLGIPPAQPGGPLGPGSGPGGSTTVDPNKPDADGGDGGESQRPPHPKQDLPQLPKPAKPPPESNLQPTSRT